jgi:hypothetical protein
VRASAKPVHVTGEGGNEKNLKIEKRGMTKRRAIEIRCIQKIWKSFQNKFVSKTKMRGENCSGHIKKLSEIAEENIKKFLNQNIYKLDKEETTTHR